MDNLKLKRKPEKYLNETEVKILSIKYEKNYIIVKTVTMDGNMTFGLDKNFKVQFTSM